MMNKIICSECGGGKAFSKMREDYICVDCDPFFKNCNEVYDELVEDVAKIVNKDLKEEL